MKSKVKRQPPKLNGNQQLDTLVWRDRKKMGALGCGCNQSVFAAYDGDEILALTCSDNDHLGRMLEKHEPSLSKPFVLANLVSAIGPWIKNVIAFRYDPKTNAVHSGLYSTNHLNNKDLSK